MPNVAIPGLAPDQLVQDVFAKPDQSMFTYEELAYKMLVKVKTVMSWVRKGVIPSPVYIGHTARFTLDQVKQIIADGLKPVGTYPPTDSPRRAIGKRGGRRRKNRPRKRPIKKPAPKPPAKVAAKKKVRK